MCFAPKRRALVEKCSVPVSFFLHFWLRNVPRATTACTFSTSQLLKSGPKLVCFVHFDLEMCFAPQWRAIFHLSFGQLAPHLWSHKSLEKHSFSRVSYLFAYLDLLSSETFSFFFSSLLFSDSSHLCFSSVHIVGSLTSKLPSINNLSFVACWNPVPRRIDSAVCTATKVWSLGGSCEGSTRPAFSKLVWAITSQDGSLVVPCHV